MAGLIDAARETGARVHVVHVSAAAVLPLLRAAVADGVRITAETCPHYLALAAEDVPDGATQFKCCPPMRDAANRDALWAGAGRRHARPAWSPTTRPAPPELKRLDSGDFGAAWGGIASLQLSLPVVWTAAAAARAVARGRRRRWMAARPGRAGRAGRQGRDRGRVRRRPGRVRPGRGFAVDPARLRHRNPVSAYAGRTLRGVVRTTWLRGEPGRTASPAGRLL